LILDNRTVRVNSGLFDEKRWNGILKKTLVLHSHKLFIVEHMKTAKVAKGNQSGYFLSIKKIGERKNA
jgi:hypothetical protein